MKTHPDFDENDPRFREFFLRDALFNKAVHAGVPIVDLVYRLLADRADKGEQITGSLKTHQGDPVDGILLNAWQLGQFLNGHRANISFVRWPGEMPSRMFMTQDNVLIYQGAERNLEVIISGVYWQLEYGDKIIFEDGKTPIVKRA